jgi:membrane protein
MHRGSPPKTAAAPAVRRVPPWRRAWQLLRDAVRGWLAHDGARLGASIAFYAIFALAPLLVISIAMAGAVFGEEAARGAIFGELEGLVGADAARGAQSLLEAAWRESRGGPGDIASLLAIGTLLVGATGVFVELRNALDTVWEIEEPAEQPALTLLLRARLAAFALVLAIGFLAIVSLLLSAGLAAAANWVSGGVEVLRVLLRLIETVVSLAVLTAAFALLLRWLPARRPPARAVWVGAIASALLFAVGKNFIGLYLGRAGVTSAYGAAGSFVVLILWVYYSAQLLLFGAELGRVAARTDGAAGGDPGVTTESGRGSPTRRAG